tara:strand:- start:256 stop:387 length:132 start_codon:yes stop_codon:yes gene_type:complete
MEIVRLTMREWIREIFATLLFFIAMALVCVVMVLIFPDPLLWR